MIYYFLLNHAYKGGTLKMTFFQVFQHLCYCMDSEDGFDKYQILIRT